MKKKGNKKCKAVSSFKDIKFDRSLIMILLAILTIIFSFIIYSHYSIKIPPKEETMHVGDECITNVDCPQPKCVGMKNLCENGYCVIRQIDSTTVRCIDLKVPVCGNDICESDEKDECPEDCL